MTTANTPSESPTPAEDKNRLISLPEAAELYGFNAQYLSQLAKKGRLQAQKIGGMWLTTPQNVEIYITVLKDPVMQPRRHIIDGLKEPQTFPYNCSTGTSSSLTRLP